MSPSAIALTVIFIIVVSGSVLGFYAGTRHKMSLEQWTVGSRGFGPVLMWLLMAGETYTTFSFLGASGWAYSRGGPALYILGYLPLASVLGYFILPPVWELGRKHGLQTQPDFFLVQYHNKYLAAFVAATGVVCLIPYLLIQLIGLGIIVEIASFDAISRTQAMIVAVVLLGGFVFVSGIRAVAWVSVPKDILMVVASVAIGIAIPTIYFGGIGRMFSVLARSHPAHLLMPGSTANLSHSWYISTVLLSALGLSMWPQGFGATFTAGSAETIRRNTIVMPMYNLSLAFIFFAGFTAYLVIPGLANGDLSMLTLVRKTFPAWMLGLLGGAGALTAMVPAAVHILTASTLFSKNLYRPIFAPDMSDDQVARLARIMVVVLSLVSLIVAIYSSLSLVSLLLLGYAGVTQFLPGVVLGLFWKRVTMAGVFTGLASGVGCAAVLILSNHDPFHGINAGFLALCINFTVAVLLSVAVGSGQPTLQAFPTGR
jgi:solute:Na+ symporter, SSS family